MDVKDKTEGIRGSILKSLSRIRRPLWELLQQHPAKNNKEEFYLRKKKAMQAVLRLLTKKVERAKTIGEMRQVEEEAKGLESKEQGTLFLRRDELVKELKLAQTAGMKAQVDQPKGDT